VIGAVIARLDVTVESGTDGTTCAAKNSRKLGPSELELVLAQKFDATPLASRQRLAKGLRGVETGSVDLNVPVGASEALISKVPVSGVRGFVKDRLKFALQIAIRAIQGHIGGLQRTPSVRALSSLLPLTRLSCQVCPPTLSAVSPDSLSENRLQCSEEAQERNSPW